MYVPISSYLEYDICWKHFTYEPIVAFIIDLLRCSAHKVYLFFTLLSSLMSRIGVFHLIFSLCLNLALSTPRRVFNCLHVEK